MLHESTVVKHNLFFSKKSLIEDILLTNDYYMDLEKCFQKLKVKHYSIESMRKLIKDSVYVDEIIDYLIDNKLLNDELYCQNVISTLVDSTQYSRNRVIKKLEDDDVDNAIIIKIIEQFDFDDLTKINKLVQKKVLANRIDSTVVIKNKLLNYLSGLYFEYSDIKYCLNEFDFDETINASNYYQKLIRTNIKEEDIKSKMHKKGFNSVTIEQITRGDE